ncbi:MAG: hypothetical protein PHD49_02645 [Candidatus Shapirobacteria bacterium]|nr:hypothetical protein [Candidatus Shapirobacteria bacterium]
MSLGINQERTTFDPLEWENNLPLVNATQETALYKKRQEWRKQENGFLKTKQFFEYYMDGWLIDPDMLFFCRQIGWIDKKDKITKSGSDVIKSLEGDKWLIFCTTKIKEISRKKKEIERLLLKDDFKYGLIRAEGNKIIFWFAKFLELLGLASEDLNSEKDKYAQYAFKLGENGIEVLTNAMIEINREKKSKIFGGFLKKFLRNTLSWILRWLLVIFIVSILICFLCKIGVIKISNFLEFLKKLLPIVLDLN